MSIFSRRHILRVIRETLAFEPKQSFFFQRLHRSILYEIVIMADFRANKVIRKIGMNDACGVLRIGAARDCPCPAFFFSNREE